MIEYGHTHLKYDLKRLSQNSKVVIYGAGEIGNYICNNLKEKSLGNVVYFVDQNADNLKYLNSIEVLKPHQLTEVDFDFVFIATIKYVAEVKPHLMNMFGIEERKILYPLPFEYFELLEIFENNL